VSERVPDGYRPLSTAPRDGTTVFLWAEACGIGEAPWKWDPERVNWPFNTTPGTWVLLGGGMCWSEEHPEGAPTHWKPALQ